MSPDHGDTWQPMPGKSGNGGAAEFQPLFLVVCNHPSATTEYLAFVATPQSLWRAQFQDGQWEWDEPDVGGGAPFGVYVAPDKRIFALFFDRLMVSDGDGESWSTHGKADFWNFFDDPLKLETPVMNSQGDLFVRVGFEGVFRYGASSGATGLVNSGFSGHSSGWGWIDHETTVMAITIDSEGYLYAAASGRIYRSSKSTVIGIPQLIGPEGDGVPLAAQLAWTSTPNATAYDVRLSENDGFSGGQGLFVSVPEPTTTYDLQMPIPSGLGGGTTNVLGPNTTYYWKVRARNSSAVGLWSGVEEFTTTDGPPDAPTLLFPVHRDDAVSRTPDFRWQAEGAIHYHLEVATDREFKSLVIDLQPIKMEGYSVLPASVKPGLQLPADTTFYWRVRAYNSEGWSGWSPVWMFATQR